MIGNKHYREHYEGMYLNGENRAHMIRQAHSKRIRGENKNSKTSHLSMHYSTIDNTQTEKQTKCPLTEWIKAHTSTVKESKNAICINL